MSRISRWLCRRLYGRSQRPFAVAAISLQTEGRDVAVYVEYRGVWYRVIREFNEGPISHIVEPNGIRAAIRRGP